MGHIGLTPQSIHQIGGFRVQGREAPAARQLLADAVGLQEAGCFAMVLECVPAELAHEITGQLTVPTIGIGAGPHTTGQVLVLQDLLGMDRDFKPRFLRSYLNGFDLIADALARWAEDVREQRFPSAEESYR
jgi:3-methyl-2-oxobutanoate hydroxymethyltransferase